MTKIVDIGDGIKIGQEDFVIIAGPCAVESEKQIEDVAKFLNSLNINILRGGAFKPRTSPYSFQGLGFEALKLLKNIREKYNMKIISEILDVRDVKKYYNYIDIYQIGSRNMQNFSLLKEIGKTNKPVVLKRGMSSTIKEWLMAAEYIKSEGNNKIILCERGIRTFEEYTRNTLDLMSVPIIKSLSEFPIIVDPSHGTGRKELILPASRAALAIGADGLMIEIHPKPSQALSDGFQSLNFKEFKNLVENVYKFKNRLIN